MVGGINAGGVVVANCEQLLMTYVRPPNEELPPEP